MTNTTASLSWNPPEDDGGAEITNYVIEYRSEGSRKWNRANKNPVPRTSYTIKDLVEDNIYEFRVAAENKAGVGQASDPTAPVKQKEILGKFNFPFLYDIFYVCILNSTI